MGLAAGRRRRLPPHVGALGTVADPACRVAPRTRSAAGASLAHVQSQNVLLFRDLHWRHAGGNRAARKAAPSHGGRSRLLPADRRRRDRLCGAAEEGRVMLGAVELARAGGNAAGEPRACRQARHCRGRGAARRSRRASAGAGRRRLRRDRRRRRLSAARDRRLHERVRRRRSLVRRLVRRDGEHHPMSPPWAGGRSPSSTRSGRRATAGAAPVLDGLRAASERFGVPLVGGHTNIRTDRGQLSVAILGRAKTLC